MLFNIKDLSSLQEARHDSETSTIDSGTSTIDSGNSTLKLKKPVPYE